MMLSAPSQLLLRNEALFNEGNWVFANPADAQIFTELADHAIDGFHQYFDVYERCKNSVQSHVFGAALSEHQHYDGAVIFMPKAKLHAAMLIANMAACVKPGGTILLVGENKSGIKSAPTLFGETYAPVNKIDSARHCSLYAASVNQVHTFEIEDWLTYKTFSIANSTLDIAFLPGVFSFKELDPGTQLLLANTPKKVKGRVLDFACGAGVIGAYIQQQFPEVEVVLSDVSALAIYCSQKSLQANQLRGQVIASNGLDNVEGRFDNIFSNPPFHTGIKTEYSIAQSFIETSRTYMHSRGNLMIVANRFLPYPDMIEKCFGHCISIAQTTKFNLYCANS